MTVEKLTNEQAQSAWDEVAKEREADDESPPSKVAAAELSAEDNSDSDPAQGEDTNGAGDELAADDDSAEPEDDPYAGLSPALKSRLQALEADSVKVKELEHKVKTAEGRVAAMQREADVARNAAKVVDHAPTAAAIAAAKISTDKWDSLKADFPEWAEATDQFVQAKLAGLKPSETKGLTPAEVAVVVEKAVEESKVESKHEDWKDVIATSEFATWYEAQDEATKSLGASKRAKDAISLLDSYAKSKSTKVEDVQADRKNKLAAAVSQGPGAARTPSKTVDQMTAKELWAFEAKRAAKRGNERGLVY